MPNLVLFATYMTEILHKFLLAGHTYTHTDITDIQSHLNTSKHPPVRGNTIMYLPFIAAPCARPCCYDAINRNNGFPL